MRAFMPENLKHKGVSLRIYLDDVHNRGCPICTFLKPSLSVVWRLITFQLPLSFFTSLFSMNVGDWTGDPENSTLRRVMILMGSASAAIIVVALLAAFFPLWYGQASERAKGLKKLNTKVSQASSRFGAFMNWWHAGPKDERAQEDNAESEDEDEDEDEEALSDGHYQ